MPGSLSLDEDATGSDAESAPGSEIDELAGMFGSIPVPDTWEATGVGSGGYLTHHTAQKGTEPDYDSNNEMFTEIGNITCLAPSKVEETNDLNCIHLQEYDGSILGNTEPPDGIYPIAFSLPHQQYFEECGIAWGVQWEVARIVTTYPNFGWSDISKETLLDLCGSNETMAPLVPEILFGKSEQFSEYAQQERLKIVPKLAAAWADYDEEEEYIRRERGSTHTNENGGNITQRVRLQVQPTNVKARFKFVLEQPTKSKSCRFNRFLGSRRIIQCYFSENDRRRYGSDIIEFFASSRLLILGRLYKAFYGHDSKVELMEINEDFGRIPDDLLGDYNRISYLDFIAWHNSVELNSNQSVGKWAARFALGFSTTLVGITFAHDKINFIDDEYAPGASSENHEAHQVMTDGCGFLNRAALKAIQERMGWDIFPVHVQARIAGSKGLFVLHPKREHQCPDGPPEIWIRASQDKVKLQAKDSWSPFHYILDVCSSPFFQTPSAIAYEMILCLSQDGEGVPDQVFEERLHQSLEDIATIHKPSTHFCGSHVLWDSIYNVHRVQQSRLRQILSPEQQRAHGFLSYEDDDANQDDVVSAKWDAAPDQYSGMPATSQEQVLGWIQSGFSPADPWVMEKLVYLQKKLLDTAVKKFRIIIPKSLRAHIIPDPLGVLNEGDVFFASSQTQLEDSFGTKRYCITGPVIVSRNPCVQKSDVRKVNAVENRRLLLSGYTDVIIFSTKGSCSLASILSGGDYDGDTVVLIWDEAITGNFTNSDLSPARPQDGFEKDNFNKSNQKLRDIVARLTLQNDDRELALARILLQGAVAKLEEGRYNTFYRNSLYLHGLSHPDTIRLGHMFTSCLDSTKSGLTVKPQVISADAKRWEKAPPECFARTREQDESKGHKRNLGRRDEALPVFVLDNLLRVADEAAAKFHHDLSIMRDQIVKSNNRDEDLVGPFEDSRARAQRYGFTDELERIQNYVEEYRSFFRQARGNQGPFSPKKLRGKAKGAGIADRQESARAVSEAYNSNMPSNLAHFDDVAVRRIAASYAYNLDNSYPEPDYNFCFGVAWAELCAIKARATGGDFTTLASGYMNSMSMNKKIAKLYREEMGVA